ncbi:MAG: uncharacterized protein QOE92_1444 [Chloroflexota bacterium]|jgi:predicted DNA-binding protein YlxM (UPF0122 family)|nr:uncharacterized protein [Chloroflexota bacterium]
MERRHHLERLLDAYAGLLTEHQRETLRLHLDSDWSYAEIAAAQGVTRMAVYDLVHRTGSVLDDYEAKLGLVAAEDRRRRDRDELTGRLHELQAEITELRRSVKDLS